MKFANVLVHDVDLAEEIVQEAFARAWAAPNTPSPEVEFRRYLYRIITNLAHDYYRRQSRRATMQTSAPTALNPLETVEKRAGDEAMRRAIRILGLRERQAIYLRISRTSHSRKRRGSWARVRAPCESSSSGRSENCGAS